MAYSFRNLIAVLLLTGRGFAGAQELPDLDLMKTLPINLDAESSEFDRKQNQLFFPRPQNQPGRCSKSLPMRPRPRAWISKNARWEFLGNVVIDNAGTTAHSDYAEIMFRDHRISSAVMQGEPAVSNSCRSTRKERPKAAPASDGIRCR